MAKTVRQKRKNRSSRPIVRQVNSKKKHLNPTANAIIAENWNKKQTLTQNYRRLGLVTRLQKVTGGSEPVLKAGPDDEETLARPPRKNPFAIRALPPSAVTETRVERDAAGRIVRVLGPLDGRANPLDDPLACLDSESEAEGEEDARAEGRRQHRAWEEWGGIEEEENNDDDEERETTSVVKLLEEQARRPVAKTVRHISAREREWLEALVERHGDDTAAMAKDKRLNPMQQTATDIARRIRKMRGES